MTMNAERASSFRLETTPLTVAYWATALLFALAWWVTPFPPLIDYPQHVAVGAHRNDRLLQGRAKLVDERAQALLQALLCAANLRPQAAQVGGGGIKHVALFADALGDTALQAGT